MAKDLIFLDESGVNLALLRLFARSEKGQRAYGERPHKRGQNVSIIGAMGFQGIIAQCSLMGGTDAVTFEAFISQKLVPKLWKGACVIMDNYSIHKGEKIRSLIEGVGANYNSSRKSNIRELVSGRCPLTNPPYSLDFLESPVQPIAEKGKLFLGNHPSKG